MNDSESWLSGILNKRTPDAIRILADLVQAGLAKGECSANDIRDVEFSQPNVIGAVFKTLRAVGFVSTNEVLKSTKPHRHAGMILKWRLEDRGRAERFIQSQRRMIVVASTESREMKQASLFETTQLPSGVMVSR